MGVAFRWNQSAADAIAAFTTRSPPSSMVAAPVPSKAKHDHADRPWSTTIIPHTSNSSTKDLTNTTRYAAVNVTAFGRMRLPGNWRKHTLALYFLSEEIGERTQGLGPRRTTGGVSGAVSLVPRQGTGKLVSEVELDFGAGMVRQLVDPNDADPWVFVDLEEPVRLERRGVYVLVTRVSEEVSGEGGVVPGPSGGLPQREETSNASSVLEQGEELKGRAVSRLRDKLIKSNTKTNGGRRSGRRGEKRRAGDGPADGEGGGDDAAQTTEQINDATSPRSDDLWMEKSKYTVAHGFSEALEMLGSVRWNATTRSWDWKQDSEGYGPVNARMVRYYDEVFSKKDGRREAMPGRIIGRSTSTTDPRGDGSSGDSPAVGTTKKFSKKIDGRREAMPGRIIRDSYRRSWIIGRSTEDSRGDEGRENAAKVGDEEEGSSPGLASLMASASAIEDEAIEAIQGEELSWGGEELSGDDVMGRRGVSSPGGKEDEEEDLLIVSQTS